MKDNPRGRPSVESWLVRISRMLVPVAFLVIFAGCAISIVVSVQGRPPGWDDVIISNLATIDNNPDGWLVVVGSTTLGGVLLLPSAGLFAGAFMRLRSGWGMLGALLYGLGVLAMLAWAVSTPLSEGYTGFHINLSYFAYMSCVGGLGICHTVIALRPNAVRLLWVGSGALLAAAFLILVCFFFHDTIFEYSAWLLPVTEWAAALLVALTATALAYSVEPLRVPQ